VPQTSDEPPALTIGVAAFIVAIGVTYVISAAWSCPCRAGTFESNWYNMLNSPIGDFVYLLVFLAAGFISGLIFYALWRWWHWYS